MYLGSKGLPSKKSFAPCLIRRGTVANITLPSPSPPLHAHTHACTHIHIVYTYAFTPRENATRTRIHVRRKAPSICIILIRVKKNKGGCFLLRGEIPPAPAARVARAFLVGAVPCGVSNVAAPTTGKVSKLYSGLRISRISIPYYTTYYLTQTSSRSASPPSSVAPSAVLLLALNFATRPTFRQVASPHLPLTLKLTGRTFLSTRCTRIRDSHSFDSTQLNYADTISRCRISRVDRIITDSQSFSLGFTKNHPPHGRASVSLRISPDLGGRCALSYNKDV